MHRKFYFDTTERDKLVDPSVDGRKTDITKTAHKV
jgi:hypothetical protein